MEYGCTQHTRDMVDGLFPCFALQESFQDFQALEDRITLVATKVVHLGDQLESTNNRRSSMEEARDVLIYLNEFKSKSVPSSGVFIQVNRVRRRAGRVVREGSVVVRERAGRVVREGGVVVRGGREGGVVVHPSVSVITPTDP